MSQYAHSDDDWDKRWAELSLSDVANTISVESLASVTTSELQSSSPEQQQSRPRTRAVDQFAGYEWQPWHQDNHQVLVVSGERPWYRSAAYSNKVGPHYIPTNLWRALEDNFDVKFARPELGQTLSTLNYADRFHALLWIEEFRHRECLKKYQMSGVRLVPNGRFLAVTVPGLADNRPSLIVGDKIIINDPNEYGETKHFFEGYVHEIRKTEILLRFHNKFHEDFEIYFSKIYFNIKFHMNRTLFRRCHHAMDLVRSSVPNRPSNIVERILFPVESRISQSRPLVDTKVADIRWVNLSLNPQQKWAVKQALRASFRPTPFIIYGPPGTGKTVTIVESILQVFIEMLAKGKPSRVLACTSANSSADLIAEKLLESKLVTNQDLIRVTAFHRKDSVPDSVKSVTRVADEDHTKWLNHRIIVTTTSHAGIIFNQDIPLNHFSHLFIDEAAQVTEPESLIPITLCARGEAAIILAGDHKQLGPVILSPLARQQGLGQSLMERLMVNLEAYHRNDAYKDLGSYDPKFVVKLVYNYRSDEKIMTIPSELFYHNELCFIAKTDENLLKAIDYKSPLVFFGLKGEDRQEADSPSWYNPVEVDYVCATVKALYDAGVLADDIGVITPYRKQMNKIKELFQEEGIQECRVATIEEFQGIEKRIIIISTVRSVPQHVNHDHNFNLGFIFNAKRFNVAISRAMSLLIVIGDQYMLGEFDSFWKRIVDWCIDHNSCFFIDNDGLNETHIRADRFGDESTASDTLLSQSCGPDFRRKLFGPKYKTVNNK